MLEETVEEVAGRMERAADRCRNAKDKSGEAAALDAAAAARACGHLEAALNIERAFLTEQWKRHPGAPWAESGGFFGFCRRLLWGSFDHNGTQGGIIRPMQQPVWNFEQEPYDEPTDETFFNLRAYFDRMPDEKMQQYRKSWSDQQVIEWDGNFKDEGSLLLPCTERDVDVAEYRRVIAQAIEYRNRVRPALKTPTPAR